MATVARAAVKQGGKITWASVADDPELQLLRTRRHAAGQRQHPERDRCRNPFHFNAAGVASVNTRLLHVDHEDLDSPETIDYKINPKAKWSDGSAALVAGPAGRGEGRAAARTRSSRSPPRRVTTRSRTSSRVPTTRKRSSRSRKPSPTGSRCSRRSFPHSLTTLRPRSTSGGSSQAAGHRRPVQVGLAGQDGADLHRRA